MPLSSIVVIVVRLFAINWLFTSIPMFLSDAVKGARERDRVVAMLHYTPALVLLIGAAALWILSPVIARLVSRGADTSVSIGSLSRSDLYSFAFVFLGLYFVLSSFADVINWIHYFATVPSGKSIYEPRVYNLYSLTRPCLTLAAGLVSIFGAPHWTRKLVAYDQKSQAA